MTYGLNPYITNTTNPNSPFYENPCDFCKTMDCENCEFNKDDE